MFTLYTCHPVYCVSMYARAELYLLIYLNFHSVWSWAIALPSVVLLFGFSSFRYIDSNQAKDVDWNFERMNALLHNNSNNNNGIKWNKSLLTKNDVKIMNGSDRRKEQFNTLSVDSNASMAQPYLCCILITQVKIMQK